jgi:hypothetical protein
VEEMHLSGLVNYYPKRSHKVWTPENPQKLLINWQERENDFKSILPKLSELYNKRAEASFSVKVFSGSKELRLMLEDIIDYKRNIFAYASWDDLAKVFTPQVAWNFFERLSEHFLSIQLLVPQTASALVFKTNQSVYRKVKFLPQALAAELSACFIYGDRLVLIRLLENSPQGVILQDEALARQQRMLLQNFWERS